MEIGKTPANQKRMIFKNKNKLAIDKCRKICYNIQKRLFYRMRIIPISKLPQTDNAE